jgi:hypothetical protein
MVSDHTRSLHKEMPFFRAFGSYFSLQMVLERVIADDNRNHNLEVEGRQLDFDYTRLGAQSDSFLFVCKRKLDTLDERDIGLISDAEIMGGFRGLLDDTFESLLLMNIDAY